MGKITVLVVDDHAMMRDGIRALIGLHDDIEIAGEAADGTEAITKAQELSPDVIIMDIAMVGLSGIEATRRIKKKNPKVMIVMLTQHDKREYILSSIKAGATGYVPKKALGSDLVAAIRAVHRGESFLYPSAAAALIKDYVEQIGEADDPYNRLTNREREVFKLIAEGNTSRVIADLLYISLKTVLAHRTRLMEKLDIHNRTKLIQYAINKGVIDLNT